MPSKDSLQSSAPRGRHFERERQPKASFCAVLGWVQKKNDLTLQRFLSAGLELRRQTHEHAGYAPGTMQRDRDQDRLEADFEAACGVPPRSAQREILPLIHKHTMGGTRVLVAELPTGTGKTNLGLTASYWTRRRTLYVCHTLTLQTQLAHDVAKREWIQTPVVLFGRNHYICQRRLAVVDLEKIVTSGPNRFYVLKVLRALSAECRHASTDRRDPVWFSSIRERARDELRNVLDDATFYKVWEKVSAKGCDCHNKKMDTVCAYRHLSLDARTAQFVILNSSILMTLAALGKLVEVFDTEKVFGLFYAYFMTTESFV